jgi:hypothetical protein
LEEKGLLEGIRSDRYLGILVALLSIATAFAAYQVALADAKAGELEVDAIKTLTESNTEFLRSNQEVMLDYAAYDNYVIGGENDEAIADYYRGGFSEALEASLDRVEGPFDEAYFDETFSEADLLYDEALDGFDEAEAAGVVADRLQLVMLVLAVGLSLGAYASLGDRRGNVALTFIVIATITLLFGVVRLGILLL